MDDFTHLIQLLESAKQLADLNELAMLSYLLGMAKDETRAHRSLLRSRKCGKPRNA